MPDLFLSYSRRDKEFVERLFKALDGRGKDVWADFDDIPGAAAWRGELQSGITESDAFVFVISPSSAASDYCRQEIEQAAELNKRVVPVVLEPVPDADVPEPAAAHQWISFAGRDFDEALDELVQAIDTDLELTREHTRYLVAAQEWDGKDRDASFLLRGTELGAAEGWLARPKEGKAPEPTPLQYEFVQASRNAATRRQRAVVGGVGVALVVALGLAVVALVQRSDAIDKEKLARSRELGANAALNLDRDPELSVRLAAKAVDAKPTAEAEEALREALAASHIRAAPRLGARVTRVRYSPDGRLALAAGGGSAFVFRARDGGQVRRLREPAEFENAAEFSPDGRLVATGGDGHDVHLWDAGSGRMVRRLQGHFGRIADLEFSGRALVATGASGATEAWDFRTGHTGRPPGPRPVVTTPRGQYLTPVRSPDGRLSLRPRADGTLELLRGGAPVAVLRTRGRRTAVYGGHFETAAFSPDGRRIVTGDVQGDLQLWDSRGRAIATLGGHSAAVLSASFSPDGTSVVSASADHTARVWDLATDKATAVLRARGQEVVGAAFSPDGDSVLTAGRDGRARIWDPFDLPVEHGLRFPRHDRSQSVRFDAGGRHLVVLDDGLHPTVLAANSGAPAPRAAVAGPRPRGPLEGARGASMLTASPRAGKVAGLAGNGRVAIWDRRTGRRLRELPRQPGQVDGIYFRSDGRSLLTTGTKARVWDVESGRQVARLPLKEPAQLGALSADGRLAMTGGGDGEGPQRALVWQLGRRAPALALRHDEVMTTTAFSADSRVVLTASYDGTVRLWDAGTGGQLASVPGTAAAFGPGARTVAAAGNGPARLYRCDFCGTLDDLRAAARRAVTQ